MWRENRSRHWYTWQRVVGRADLIVRAYLSTGVFARRPPILAWTGTHAGVVLECEHGQSKQSRHESREITRCLETVNGEFPPLARLTAGG